MVFLHPNCEKEMKENEEQEKIVWIAFDFQIEFKRNVNMVLNIGFCGDFDSKFPIWFAKS